MPSSHLSCQYYLLGQLYTVLQTLEPRVNIFFYLKYIENAYKESSLYQYNNGFNYNIRLHIPCKKYSVDGAIYC